MVRRILENEQRPDELPEASLSDLLAAIKALRPGETLSIQAVEHLNTLAERLNKEAGA